MIASDSELLVAALVTWLAIGVVLSVVLGRRGHDGFSWFVLGTLLGPLAVLFAISAWRSDERLDAHVVADPAVGGASNGIDVLLGYDGSAESRACITATVELFGSRLGRLTLATVPFDGDREAEVVHGHPAEALSARAAEGAYDVLAIGARGAGRARLFGSASNTLARHASVPLLVVPGDSPGR